MAPTPESPITRASTVPLEKSPPPKIGGKRGWSCVGLRIDSRYGDG